MGRSRNGRRGGENYDALHPSNATNAQADRQRMIERMYIRVLGELCMNRFEWKGFPDSVDTRWLELNAYRTGLCVIWYDQADTGKLYAMQGSGHGLKNRQDNYRSFLVVGPAFPGKTVSVRRAVPVWSNYFRQPDLDIVRIYAQKLAHIDRTIEINSSNARQTKIITVSENGQLTAKAINTAIENGERAIEVSIDVGELVQALDIGVDGPLLDSLAALRSKLWNECMGLLGIDNANQEKKERLVESEVGANDDQTDKMRRVNLNARQQAAKEINKKFADLLDGKEVTVDYYKEPIQAEMPAPFTSEEEF